MQLEEEVGGIFYLYPLPPCIEPGHRRSPLITDLLGAEIRLIDRVRLRGPADEFLTYDALMFEPDIDIAPRLINDNATLQDAVAPFLFQGGFILAISRSVDPFQFGLISRASRSQTKKRVLYDDPPRR